LASACQNGSGTSNESSAQRSGGAMHHRSGSARPGQTWERRDASR
jgi:hypothetical protein